MVTINPEWEMAFRDWSKENDKAIAWLMASWKRELEDKEIAVLEYKKHKRLSLKYVSRMKEILDQNKLIL